MCVAAPLATERPPHLLVVDVVHLVKDHPLDIADDVGAAVEHRAGRPHVQD